MNNIDNFETKLDIEPFEDVIIDYKKPIFNDNFIEDADEDYKFLRNKMRFFMASGEFILNKAINALNSDPSPRLVESSSQILKNCVEISEKILLLHEKTKNIKKIDNVDEENSIKDGEINTSLVDIINSIDKIEMKK